MASRLATGRYRDGGWSGMGPDLIAIAPWQAGDPPSKGTHLEAIALLLYSNTVEKYNLNCSKWIPALR